MSGSTALLKSTKQEHIRANLNALHFNVNNVRVSPDRVTVLIRKDAKFATRAVTCPEALQDSRRQMLKVAYKNWGEAVLSSVVKYTDTEKHYGVVQSQGDTAIDVHYHNADALAASVIRKASINPFKSPMAMYVSLDDQINSHVFSMSAVGGDFAEVGFSRLFTLDGEQQAYVGRPGKGDIQTQIKTVGECLARRKKGRLPRVPIIFLEDNVRHAKTILWVMDKMERAGVFKHGYVAAVATCFSVASEEEKDKIQFEGKRVPLHVGYEYSGGPIDNVTTRDHLFDGYVVADKGQLGRLPSFMDEVYEANTRFCEEVEAVTNSTLTLAHFTPGPMMASVMGMPLDTPMRQALDKADRDGRKKYPRLHVLKR